MAQTRVAGQIIDLVGQAFDDPADDSKIGAKRMINAGNQRIAIRRQRTTTAGTFLPAGRVPLSATTGEAGDYVRKARIEVKTTGKAGVWLFQDGDPVFAQGTTGSAITGASVTLSGGTASATAAIDTLEGRVASIFYVPTGGAGQWVHSRIATHGAISGTSIALTLEDAIPAGAAPTQWIIEGTKARRILAPSTAARDEPYEIEIGESSVFGGWRVSMDIGSTVSEWWGWFSGGAA